LGVAPLGGKENASNSDESNILLLLLLLLILLLRKRLVDAYPAGCNRRVPPSVRPPVRPLGLLLLHEMFSLIKRLMADLVASVSQ